MANIGRYQGPEDTLKGFQVLLFSKQRIDETQLWKSPGQENIYIFYIYI